jgi:hypothetical protein
VPAGTPAQPATTPVIPSGLPAARTPQPAPATTAAPARSWVPIWRRWHTDRVECGCVTCPCQGKAGVAAAPGQQPAAPASVDLLTPPPVPSRWGATAATTPSGDPKTTATAASAGPLTPLYPSRKWPPAHTVRPATPAPTASGGSAETSEPPAAAGEDPGLLTPADLQKRVRAACGSLARSVTVLAQPDRTLLIRVGVKDVLAQKQAAGKVLQMPELSQPGIGLLVEVLP